MFFNYLSESRSEVPGPKTKKCILSEYATVIAVIFKNEAAVTNVRSGPYMEFSIIDFIFF